MPPAPGRSESLWPSVFTRTLRAVADAAPLLAQLVEREAACYRERRMVAYEADRFLLDIFADTTERTPTFSIPPFRRMSDPDATPNPWAIAYNSSVSSDAAWSSMLGRDPIGLHWDAQTYRRLGVESIARLCPVLDEAEIRSYPVGRDATRLYSEAIGMTLNVDRAKGAFRMAERGARGHVYEIHLPDTPSALEVCEHIAIKLVFNTLSTATMALLGRIRGNWMVQVSPTNKKLVDRSIRIIADLTSRSYESAAELFFREADRRGGPTPSMVSEIIAANDAGA